MTEIPDYKSASSNRLSSNCTLLEYFVTDWEPSAVDHDQCEIDQWRSDLAKVLEECRSKKSDRLWSAVLTVCVSLQIAIILYISLFQG